MKLAISLAMVILAPPALADEILKNDELRAFVTAKPLQIERARDRALVRLDLKPDGTLYQNTTTNGKVFAGGGTWKLNDNGSKFCLELQGAGNSGGCFGVMRAESGTTLFTGPGTSPTPFGRVME